ncbi:MAG: DUF3035 domain-containing protein [Henriciella sp.]|uniref:DUF3035 domain-containing protein n=1 Tax=Henriciella sp. TaxID=1968823 RepID=UPI002608D3D7|nr:DUF3035 domain-containing protein [Henriciella sp.]
MRRAILTMSAMGAILAVASCGGNTASGPDEFRVVTKAPLSVPPEYSLRPPPAGTSVPAEADTSRAPTTAAFGTSIGADASAAEKALVAAAGANAVSPTIRSVVDYEEAGTVRKSSDDANQILSYRGDGTVEDSATGDEQVTIARGSSDKVKLPGT